jgi:hypothetical protein
MTTTELAPIKAKAAKGENGEKPEAAETTELSVNLSEKEANKLERCEGTLKKFSNWIVEAGEALYTIQEEKLYRQDFKTFEDYIKDKWGMSDQSAYNAIKRYKAQHLLEKSDDVELKPQPSSKAVTMIAAAIKDPDQQKRVFQKAIEKAVENKTLDKDDKQRVDIPTDIVRETINRSVAAAKTAAAKAAEKSGKSHKGSNGAVRKTGGALFKEMHKHLRAIVQLIDKAEGHTDMAVRAEATRKAAQLLSGKIDTWKKQARTKK